MTDKELRKLSRLELLEMLLAASEENEKLKEQIESLKTENRTAQSIKNLSAITDKAESILNYANSITKSLNSKPVTVEKKLPEPTSKITNHDSDNMSDREIYGRMLCFFAKNDNKLEVFPSDLENDVRARINSLLSK